MLDPASSVEMVKVLEEDPMVGGVGGDVQVSYKTINMFLTIETFQFHICMLNLRHFLCINSSPDPKQIRVMDLLPEQCTVLDGLQH